MIDEYATYKETIEQEIARARRANRRVSKERLAEVHRKAHAEVLKMEAEDD